LLTVYGTEGTVALWEFPSRCIHYHEPIRDSFGYPTHSWPEATRRKFAEQNDLNPQTMRPLNSPTRNKPEEFRFSQNPMMVHLESFFSSVKTRKQPFEDVTFGGNAVNVGHMVNVSYREGKPAFWDEKERKVKV
jgi:hypothetical protein